MFGRYKIKIRDDVTFHFLNIDDYNPRLKRYIDNSIHFIWNGDNEIIEDSDDMLITKNELKNLLNGKTEIQKIGIVSEFICHLYVRANKYNQHFLFRNLEEKGMKKGFDGLYEKNGEFFIYESKSSLDTTLDATHNSNIGEAYHDLRKKIDGTNNANDPWRNAYHHSLNRSINYNDNISKQLKALSKQYVLEKFTLIDNYNIFPSSTIYMGVRYAVIDNDDLKQKIKGLIKDYRFKSLNVFCINKKSIKNFIDYLDE